MKQWVVAAALAGSLLVYPLQAGAQNWETGTKNANLLCGYFAFPGFSFVVIENLDGKKRALCKWKCVYQTTSGATHVNAGSRELRKGESLGLEKTKKVAPGISSRVGGTASCL